MSIPRPIALLTVFALMQGNEQFRRILLHPSVIMDTIMKGVNLFQGMVNYSGIIYPRARGIIYSRIDYPGDEFIGG